MTLYILYETASGYALFERLESEEIGQELEEVSKAMLELPKFGKIVKLKSFAPFKSAAHALENMMDISEGVVNESLKSFLEMNLPKSGKKSKVQLGVGDKNLAGAIKQALNCDCVSDDMILEVIRGLRFHGEKMLKHLKDGDLGKAQLGLGHSYSRAKVKFNVNRVDNMIIQSINLLDQLDKDVNTFSMRVREWYGWHFPELVKIINDNAMYARCAKYIKNKNNLSEDSIPELEEIVGDVGKAKSIVDAARASMGTDISEIDMFNIESFADRVISLADYRKKLHSYLYSKMQQVAPNLSALVGEVVGARLIAHAGSLTNLSKYPASTVQILGAEKALFRALKTKGNTPKYGLIYHSSFIGRSSAKNKGRISRFLANKCSIASRIDCFLDTPTNKFGELLREQVEERLKFYEEGATVRTNAEVMKRAIEEVQKAVAMDDDESDNDEMDVDEASPAKRKRDEDESEKPKKKKKDDGEEDGKSEKKKKKKKSSEEEEQPSPAKSGDEGERKKKKKKKDAEAEPEEEDTSAKKKKKKKKKDAGDA
ncbi:snoRNP complex protein nop56 [Quaeritorhiza haematococci]|nr:snoRNP complex protein nop56 [Quaeritorhiza haematococci]